MKRCIITGIIAGLCFNLYASDRSISVNSNAEYENVNVIQSNIISECTSLGQQFSDSTKKYLIKNGWSVDSSDNSENHLELIITNAFSAGNAFIGHRKSVSVKANLYQNNVLVDSFIGTRNSTGGIGGPFKSSCAVLARCTNTLGNDISKWLRNKIY